MSKTNLWRMPKRMWTIFRQNDPEASGLEREEPECPGKVGLPASLKSGSRLPFMVRMCTSFIANLAALGLGTSIIVVGSLASAQAANDQSSSSDAMVPDSVSVESGLFAGTVSGGDTGAARATIVPTTATVVFKPYRSEADSFAVVGTMGATYARIGGEQAALPNNPLVAGVYARKLPMGLAIKVGLLTTAPVARANRSIAALGYSRVAAMHGFWKAAPWVPDRMPTALFSGLSWGGGGTKIGAEGLFIAAPSVVEDPRLNMAWIFGQRAGITQKASILTFGVHGLGSWNIRAETYSVALEPSIAAKAGPVTLKARGVLPVLAPTGAFFEESGVWAAFLGLSVAVPEATRSAARTSSSPIDVSKPSG